MAPTGRPVRWLKPFASVATTLSCSIMIASACDRQRSAARCSRNFPSELRNEIRTYAKKTRSFISAIADLRLSRRFSLHEPGAVGEYDAIVVGSDEVWNFRHPWYGSMPIFFGDGLRAGRIISYAASFGNHSAWDGIHPAWARKLRLYQAVTWSRCRLGRLLDALLPVLE